MIEEDRRKGTHLEEKGNVELAQLQADTTASQCAKRLRFGPDAFDVFNVF